MRYNISVLKCLGGLLQSTLSAVVLEEQQIKEASTINMLEISRNIYHEIS